MIENNGIKGELNFDLNHDNKSKKNVRKIKSKGDVLDKSVSYGGDNNSNSNVVNNTYNITNTKISEEQLQEVVGIARKEMQLAYSERLMEVELKLLEKVVRIISPLFLIANSSSRYPNEQIDMYIDVKEEESIRRQAIEKISYLTNKDLLLLRVIQEWRKIVMNFWSLTSLRPKSTYSFFEHHNKQLDEMINKIERIKSRFGDITFEDFENMRNNNILTTDNNTHTPIDEPLYKTCILDANDKSKNDEFLKENDLFAKNRDMWSNWFRDQYGGNIMMNTLTEKIRIINKSLPSSRVERAESEYMNLYWYTSKIGSYIYEKTKTYNYYK